MSDLKDKHGISFMYITHDIATARYFAEKTAVMYAGHMVEWGNSDNVTQNPQHPYSQLLLSAVPEVGNAGKRELTAKKVKFRSGDQAVSVVHLPVAVLKPARYALSLFPSRPRWEKTIMRAAITCN